MDIFSIFLPKKFMIWLISRVRHYLTHTLRSPVDKRGFFYSNNDFIHFFDTFMKHSCVIFSTFYSFYKIV
ncbi:hypothetical protein FHY68_21250 [Bacillus pacificus]|nr:hypothetical protein FHY68_21250 [Bacillus pacificus]